MAFKNPFLEKVVCARKCVKVATVEDNLVVDDVHFVMETKNL